MAAFPSPSRSAPRSTAGAVAALAATMLLSSLGTSIPNVALPTIGGVFGASVQEVQWVVLAYLVAVTALAVGAGRMGDLMGRRRLLLVGLAVFVAGSVLSAAAPALWALIAARAVQGAGAAVMMTLTVAVVRDAVPAERTGSAMGLLGTLSAIGTALGPSLGGALLAGFGWRAVFAAAVPLGLVAVWLAVRYLPADAKAAGTARPPFDGAGMALLALASGAFALAATMGDAWGPAVSGALGLLACVGAGLFVAVEARTAAPLVSLDLFRDGAVTSGLGLNALVAAVMMATLVVGPFFLAGALHLSAPVIGAVMSVGPVVSALSGVPAGRLADRFGAPAMTRSGLAVMAVGALALVVLPAMAGVGGYVAAMVVLTPGYQLFLAANTTAVMNRASGERRGAVSGLLTLARHLGFLGGAAGMGALFAVASGSGDGAVATPAAVTAGLGTTFILAAILLAAAALAATAVAVMQRDRRGEEVV